MSNLVVHSGGWLTDIVTLNTVPMPVETATYKPVSHYDSVMQVIDYAEDAGYIIKKTSVALNKSGNHMFGVLDIDRGNDENGWCIGIRNSYDKSLSFGLVGGLRTFVCDNLCFSGDLIYTHKHTKGISLKLGLNHVFDDIDSRMEGLLTMIEDSKHLPIDTGRASELTIGMVRLGAIPSYDVIRVMDEFLHPTLKHFHQYLDTYYGWISAVTYISQRYSPMKQMDTYSKLALLINL